MSRPLSSSLLVAALPLLACGGSAEAPNGGFDGGTGGRPAISCSADVRCPDDGACVAGLCVDKAAPASDLAIEIDPPPGHGVHTEIPAAAGKLPDLIVDAALNLEVTFSPVNNMTSVPNPASAIISIPSRIPGRPALVFNANIIPSLLTTTVVVPAGMRSQQATLTFLPLSPSDGVSPPFNFDITIPETGSALPSQVLPTNPLIVRGEITDPFMRKGPFTARAFQNGIFVSNAASTRGTMTNPAGSFVLLVPATTKGDVIVELWPETDGDPLVALFPMPVSTSVLDVGTMVLPTYADPNTFRVNVHGGEGDAKMPILGANVTAFTTLTGGKLAGSMTFARRGSTDAGGDVNLSLIPGDSNVPRNYTLSVVSPPGSPWASQCVEQPVLYIGSGPPPVLLRDVPLSPRPVLTGTVVSANGTPVSKVIVTATPDTGANASCPPIAGTTRVITDARGMFTLPLDPGTYQLDYDPPSGSPVPRLTEPSVSVTADTPHPVQLPTAALLEGSVLDGKGAPVADARVRLLQPHCPAVDACTAPILVAETQTDANGHFRAVVAAVTPVN